MALLWSFCLLGLIGFFNASKARTSVAGGAGGHALSSRPASMAWVPLVNQRIRFMIHSPSKVGLLLECFHDLAGQKIEIR